LAFFQKRTQNETELISYRKGSQGLQIAPGFSKDKTKCLDNLKNFWKWNKTKAFGKKF
jgi:hypothetical protein